MLWSSAMTKISKEMAKFVADQRLGFLATVCPDGSPNLSPKGLTFVFDDTQIVIGEVRSPGTLSNLKFQPIAELNVVDRNSRKGFRFKGHCEVHSEGDQFIRFEEFLKSKGAQSNIRSVIVMTVQTAQSISSPIYDQGVSEAAVRRQWQLHYQRFDTDGPVK